MTDTNSPVASDPSELLALADQQASARKRYHESDADLIRESEIIEWALRRVAAPAGNAGVREALRGLNAAVDDLWNGGRTDEAVKLICYWFEDIECGAVAADDLHGADIDAMHRLHGVAQTELGPCTQAELDAGFDAKNALLVSMWMDRALKAEAAAQSKADPEAVEFAAALIVAPLVGADFDDDGCSCPQCEAQREEAREIVRRIAHAFAATSPVSSTNHQTAKD